MSGALGISQGTPRVAPSASEGARSSSSAGPASETAQSDPTVDARAQPPSGPTDVYERGGPTAPRALVASSSGEAAPAGDATLRGELRGELARHNASGPRLRSRGTVEPRVADGEQVAETGARGEVARRQQAFVDEMRARGVEGSQPPTEAQLREYFGTFNNRQDRPQALEAYERYASAYHVHPASTDRPDADVRYSGNARYESNGRYYASRGDLERASADAIRRGRTVDYLEVRPHAPDSWSEVSDRRATHDGRRVNDCEGFAYMGQELLGAAGYRTRAVAVDGRGDLDHAMLIARDPARPRETHVVSNEQVFSPAGNRRRERQLLDDAYRAAGGELPARYYQGASQDEAQTLMMAARGG